jgi:hypothetical protein
MFAIGVLALILIFVVVMYFQRKKKAIRVHEKLRKLKALIRTNIERYDSRIQWTFQGNDEFSVARNVYKMCTDLEKKGDFRLSFFYDRRKADFEQIESILSKWAETKPDYSTKDAFLNELKKVEDIMRRW